MSSRNGYNIVTNCVNTFFEKYNFTQLQSMCVNVRASVFYLRAEYYETRTPLHGEKNLFAKTNAMFSTLLLTT